MARTKAKTTTSKTVAKKTRGRKPMTKVEKKVVNAVEELVEENVVNEKTIVNETIEKQEEPNLGETIEKQETPIVEIVNGDPSVIAPKEEEEKEEHKEIEPNKQARVVIDPLNYSWNGQEIDF